MLFLLMQILNNILTVTDGLLEKSTVELLGLAQIQQATSSRILKILDTFVSAVGSIYANQVNKTLDLRNLITKLRNVAFSNNKNVFTHDVYLLQLVKEVTYR